MSNWVNPKTNWAPPDTPSAIDFIRIEENTEYLNEVMDTIDDGTLVKTNRDAVMTAALIAKGGSDYSTAQVRNIVISTTTPTVPTGKSGTIFLVVE